MSLTVFELEIDEFEDANIDLISFVDKPAIDIDFYHFNDNSQLKLAQVDNEERRVTGPALIPDKKIERVSDDGEVYYVFFSKDTVKKASEYFFKNSNHKRTSVNHNQNEIEGNTVVESWIVDDPDTDKSLSYGFNKEDINEGTWMVTFKIDDDEFWKKIKNGELKGFSIEGKFIQKMVENMKKQDPDDKNNGHSDSEEGKGEDEKGEGEDDKDLDKIYEIAKNFIKGNNKENN